MRRGLALVHALARVTDHCPSAQCAAGLEEGMLALRHGHALRRGAPLGSLGLAGSGSEGCRRDCHCDHACAESARSSRDCAT